MYTVVWTPLAEEQAAQMWVDYQAQRDRLLELIRDIVGQLKSEPTACGESRSGVTRVVIEEFLVLFFDVIEDDRRVEVLTARRV